MKRSCSSSVWYYIKFSKNTHTLGQEKHIHLGMLPFSFYFKYLGYGFTFGAHFVSLLRLWERCFISQLWILKSLEATFFLLWQFGFYLGTKMMAVGHSCQESVGLVYTGLGREKPYVPASLQIGLIQAAFPMNPSQRRFSFTSNCHNVKRISSTDRDT